MQPKNLSILPWYDFQEKEVQESISSTQVAANIVKQILFITPNPWSMRPYKSGIYKSDCNYWEFTLWGGLLLTEHKQRDIWSRSNEISQQCVISLCLTSATSCDKSIRRVYDAFGKQTAKVE